MPSSGTPAAVAPSAAAMTPTPNAATIPRIANVTTPPYPTSVYRVRLSPRATAALSVPHDHSEPATAPP